jgi:hypothetical protein
LLKPKNNLNIVESEYNVLWNSISKFGANTF